MISSHEGSLSGIGNNLGSLVSGLELRMEGACGDKRSEQIAKYYLRAMIYLRPYEHFSILEVVLLELVPRSFPFFSCLCTQQKDS